MCDFCNRKNSRVSLKMKLSCRASIDDKKKNEERLEICIAREEIFFIVDMSDKFKRPDNLFFVAVQSHKKPIRIPAFVRPEAAI